MKFIILCSIKTTFCIAVEKGNYEIVEILLSSKKVNVNFHYISNTLFQYKCDFISYFLIQLQIDYFNKISGLMI